MEKAREFFTRTLRTPEALKLLEGIEKPDSLEEIINVYADVARQLGTELTTDEIKAYFEEKMNQKCAKGQVDDKELIQAVGGGVHPGVCKFHFKDRENCWFSDCCDVMSELYDYGDYDYCSWIWRIREF